VGVGWKKKGEEVGKSCIPGISFGFQTNSTMNKKGILKFPKCLIP